MKSPKVLAALMFLAPLSSAGPVFAQSIDLRTVALVRQDSADCTNADVTAQDPSLVGGSVGVERRPSGSGRVRVALGAQPNTTYHVSLKCGRQLGDLTTDPDGFGTADLWFNNGETSEIFAFQLSPDNAAPGSSYQSLQINLRVPGPFAGPAHIEYVGQAGDDVSFFYEGMPEGTEVAVVNATFGSNIVVSAQPLNSSIPMSGTITISGEGMYYLRARNQADKQYIAETIKFYME